MCWAGWTGRVAEASWPGMTFGTKPGAPVPGGFLPEEGFVRSRRGGWSEAGSILAKCTRR